MTCYLCESDPHLTNCPLKRIKLTFKPLTLLIFATLTSFNCFAGGNDYQNEINPSDAILSIIGESASEPECMPLISGAIKTRGTLNGVYGLHNPYVKRATGKDYQLASKAFYDAKPTTADHWLQPNELKKVKWYKKCKQVDSCGSHLFFDCPWSVA